MHVHVISKNSRRKVIAEDEGSNVLYCMHSTLQFVARSKKKMYRAAKVQVSTSDSGLCTSMYVSTLEIAGNGPNEARVLVLRATQAAANFLLFYAPKWPLLSIHTLKSAMPVTKCTKASVIFLLNKDGGVFNAFKNQ